MLKAVYNGTRVVTGMTHGDAFGKLTEAERRGDGFVSGSLCPHTGLFTDHDIRFFAKKTLMIRHGEPLSGHDADPALSPKGRTEVARIALCLVGMEGYEMRTSPMHRCVETARIIADATGIRFEVADCLSDEIADASSVLEGLPEESILICHCTLIRDVVNWVRSVGSKTPIPTASMTLIDHERVVYAGRTATDRHLK